jgi:DNA replication protein
MTMDGRFRGFPAGKLRATHIPDLFFSEVLPAIEDPAELRVILHVFWRAQARQRKVGAVSLTELQQDEALLAGLSLNVEPKGAGPALLRGLDAAVGRGVLLHLQVAGTTGSDPVEWFFLNTESGRALFERVRSGELDLGGAPMPEATSAPAERPNIFLLYERNIGLLQPLIVEELEEAERLYPIEWLEEAFKIAVEQNVRRWRYIRAILERWQNEGRDDERLGRDHPEDGRHYLTGKYADFIKH